MNICGQLFKLIARRLAFGSVLLLLRLLNSIIDIIRTTL